MKACNGWIGVQPFESSSLKIKGEEKGFITVAQKSQLTPLKVIHGTADYPSGGTAWFSSDVAKQSQSRVIYESPGGPFILVQIQFMMLYDFTEAP